MTVLLIFNPQVLVVPLWNTYDEANPRYTSWVVGGSVANDIFLIIINFGVFWRYIGLPPIRHIEQGELLTSRAGQLSSFPRLL